MIKVQNVDDNECFKWFLVRYLSLADLNPRRITKNDEDCPKTFDFKDIKIQFKIRNIHKIEKKNSITISVFGYENKEKYPIYVSKKSCERNYVDLLLMGGKRKGYYVFIKNFNTFIYDHTQHCGRNIFLIIVCNLLVQKKSYHVMLKIALKLMVNKGLRCLNFLSLQFLSY